MIQKNFRKWSVKNHPDKFPDADKQEKEEIESKFKTVSNCNDKSEYCPDEKPENIVYEKPVKKQVKEPLEIKNKDKIPEEPEPEEPKPEEPKPEEFKPSKKQVKKTLTIDDFKEGMKVKWIQYKKKIYWNCW